MTGAYGCTPVDFCFYNIKNHVGRDKVRDKRFSSSAIDATKRWQEATCRAARMCVCFLPLYCAFLSLFCLGGKLSFDQQKNESLYGSGYDPRTILSGAVEVPAEFQSLFGEISRIVDRVERPSANPSRTSASLERFSTGVDPDAALVMLNGTVIREDLKQAPSLGINLDPPSFERKST